MDFWFFSAQYLPTVGGVERYTHEVALRLAKQGHRVTVVTSAKKGLPAVEEADGIRVMRLASLPLMGGRFPVALPWAGTARAAARALQEAGPGFAVVQTRMYPLSVWAARRLARKGLPFAVIDHSTGYMPLPRLLRPFGRAWEHWALGQVQKSGGAFYGVSERVCAWLAQLGASPQGTLYNSVDPAALAETAKNGLQGWRERLGLGPGTRLLAFAGRLIPEKGAAQLMEAFRLAREAGAQNAALVIAGDGPERERLAQLCAEGVYLPGALPYADTLALLAEANLYCLPTAYAEGFPTTLLEAAALGCPILTTDTAGAAELLPDESYGTRLASNDPALFAGAIVKALASPEQGRQQAAKTRARLEERFTWDKTAAKILALAKESV